jgi:hypothetical protein
MGNLGTDIICLPDLDPYFRVQSGRVVLAHSIARRLYYLRAFLNDTFVDRQRGRLQSAVEAECERDERVLAATAAVTFNAAAHSLTVKVSLEDADGPFELILAVDQVTVTLLKGG